ncbi:MAG: Glycosyl hydrolase family 81 [Methanoregulaceae archaeon PtaB.Bin152]|nr:MAG: Glycosyl hydrolase family 81 [Methanoregulaceae archaeon PtaB.Bin152]
MRKRVLERVCLACMSRPSSYQPINTIPPESSVTMSRVFLLRILSLFFILSFTFSGLVTAAPIKLGNAYVQTERADNCRWRGSDLFECNWCLNPTPIYAEYAPVSDSMRDGQLVYGLHSWAGYTIWPNNTLNYTGAYKKSDSEPFVKVSTPFVQSTLYADPLSLTFRNRYANVDGQGRVRGLVFSMPIPAAADGAEYGPNTCTAGSTTFSPDGKTREISQKGQWVSGLRVFPAGDLNATEPGWGEAFPDNLVADRMGDWDIDFLLDRKNSTEQLKLTMAKGSPFAWFTWNDATPGESMAFQFYTGNPFNTLNLERGHVNISPVDTGIPGLGCFLVGTNQDKSFLGGVRDKTTTNWNYFAVFYDTASFTVSEYPDHGIWLTPVSPGVTRHFVIAGLPVVAYPRGSANPDAYVPTRDQALSESEAWVQALAPYAFNYVTDTKVTYNVDRTTGLLHTTYAATTANHGPAGSIAGGKTVMLLQRHQYETFNDGRNLPVYDGNLAGDTVGPAAPGQWALSMPAANNGHYQYWIAKGKLHPVAVSTFSTTYVYNNFIPFMPLMDTNATMEGVPLWHIVNNDEEGYTKKSLGVDPPLFTAIDGGDQNAAYNLAKMVRYMSAKLAIERGLSSVASANPEVTGITEFNVTPWNPSEKWNGTEWYNTSYRNPYDPRLSFSRNLKGIKDFFALYTNETPFRTEKVTAGSRNQYSPYYFLSDPRIGTIHMYPAQGPDTDDSKPAYGYWPMPDDITYPRPWGEDGFGTVTEWNDIHYQNGYLITAAAQAAWFDPAWADRDQYGAFIDQLVMSIAYDPDHAADYYTHPELKYSKMNFFDQWAGQAWTQGLPQTGPGGGVGVGSLLEDGKDDNSLGESMQAWAGIIMWGTVTNRPEIADTGIYLYTTNLYNADAYWFDKTLAYVPNASGIMQPTAAKWSTHGDYIPSVSIPDDPRKYNPDETMWDRWYNWGNPKVTSSWPVMPSGYPNATSFAPKMPQSVVQTASQFGISPTSSMYNMWLPMAGYTLSFGRDPHYVELMERALDHAPNGGFCNKTDPSGIPYLSVVNQQRALVGIRDTSATGIAVSPFQWYWDLVQTSRNTVPGQYPYDLGTWWNNVKDRIDDSTSPSEVLNWFWAIDTYGTPDFSYFGYSSDAAFKGLSQPLCAAFISPYNQVTFVAWNPHNESVHVNWWKVGEKAGLGSAALAQDLTVPPNWYAAATTGPPADAGLIVALDAPGRVGPGSTVTFNITVLATGSGPVSGVTVSDYLPYTMTYLSSSPAGTVSGNAVRWNVGGLSPGQTRTFQVTGRFPDTANGQYTAVAEASGLAAGNIPVKGNRIIPLQVAGGPSMNVTVIANATSVSPGAFLTYRILLNNNGTQDLVGVDAYDEPPPGSTFISSNYPPQNIAPSRIVWTPDKLPSGGNLPIGKTLTINMTVQVSGSASGTIKTTAGGGGAYPGGRASGEASLVTEVKA